MVCRAPTQRQGPRSITAVEIALMVIGTMNHPARPVLKEIEWIAAMGFDFIDLTLEPPAAAVWKVDLGELQKALVDHRLEIVGHTAYYLPLCSPFESVRKAAVDELKNCIEAFARLGAAWMNIHPDRNVPMHDRKWRSEERRVGKECRSRWS